MEYINGEFVMKGCDPESPDCLHSMEDLVSYINITGFLPLFSNLIPGFSVEEKVPAENWWSGEAETDPWEWRQILASHPDIAYGKFFNKNAGFISKSFFPVFANYRRNGYDFDALFEDELASYRAKKVMDVFELDDESAGKELMSSDIKELAGFGKGSGEKNFGGILADLQMQTYLIVSKFQQKKNKKGQPYGWHIAVMETPETKWGREHVASSYSEDPAESWNKITARMKQFYPDTDDKQIRKMLGIRYPGETAAKSPGPTKKEKKTKEKKKLRPQELPWPENLIMEMGFEHILTDRKLTEDQMEGLRYVMENLKESERAALKLRYEEHYTLKAVGDTFSLSGSRIQQIIAKALRKLRHPTRSVYIIQGYIGYQTMIEKKKAELAKLSCQEERIKELKKIFVTDIGLSVRSTNCLTRSGLHTLGDVAELIQKEPLQLANVRNLGRMSLLEVVEKLEEYGIDCSEARRVYGVDTQSE